MHGLLNISEATSIALHSCAWLATSDAKFSSVKKIADGLGFSANHTAKVAQQLVKAGILLSERGPSGGLKLAKTPSSITMMDLCVATGSIPTDKGCLLKSSICSGNQCVLGKVLCAENRRLMDLFIQTTLEDIVTSLGKGKSLADISDVPSLMPAIIPRN